MQWSKRIDRLFEAPPAVLSHRGQLIEANLNKERGTPDEILAEMHKSGLEQLELARRLLGVSRPAQTPLWLSIRIPDRSRWPPRAMLQLDQYRRDN